MTAEASTANMSSTPEVTFLVPVYNAEDKLERLLTSLHNQTIKNIQVVIINDGSKDGSFQIAKKFFDKDPRFFIIPSENPDCPMVKPQGTSDADWRVSLMQAAEHPANFGTSAARIAGIKVATGFYVLAIDPDDSFETDGAEGLLKRAAKKNNPDIVTFDLQQFETDENGVEHRVWKFCPAKHGYLSNKGDQSRHVALNDMLRDRHYWTLCLKMVKGELYHEAVKHLENFYCIMCEDLYMDIAVEINAKDIYKANYAPYLHYDAGITSDRGKMTLAGIRRQYSVLRALALSKKMLPDSLKTIFEAQIIKQCRFLLSRCARVEPEQDRETARLELMNYGYCKEELDIASKMPILTDTKDCGPKNKLINALLPIGSWRRHVLKTMAKRLLGH